MARGEQFIVQVIVHDRAVTTFNFDLVFKIESLFKNDVSVTKKTWLGLGFVCFFCFFYPWMKSRGGEDNSKTMTAIENLVFQGRKFALPWQ